jgi:hypothetical protein
MGQTTPTNPEKRERSPEAKVEKKAKKEKKEKKSKKSKKKGKKRKRPDSSSDDEWGLPPTLDYWVRSCFACHRCKLMSIRTICTAESCSREIPEGELLCAAR